MTSSIETILVPSDQRFCLFPLKYPVTFEFYVRQVASFWTVGEVDLAADKLDFEELTQDEREFIMRVLAFFASADGIVNENLAQNFLAEVQIPEARAFYGFQIGMEVIHTHMYSLMIETFEKDAHRREFYFKGIDTIPSIRSKADWALRWITNSRRFAERLIAFACVEGIFFSVSYCAIFYLKKRGKMPGLSFSNELIARDEGLHRDFACHVYRDLLEHKLETATVHEIVGSAVESEKLFVVDALRVSLIGMNSDLMSQYVEFVADHLLNSLGHAPMYNTSNPFDWMDMISLSGKTNFFEKRVGEYQKANVMDMADRVFALTDEF